MHDLCYVGGGLGLSVLLGNGDGSFQAARSFTAGSFPISVAVADFNSDGRQDLAVANYISSGTVTVLLEDPLARVASVVVNDGSAQRSMVTSLTVTFSTVIHLDPGAFELVRQEGGVIQLQVAQAVVDGRSVDTLTFVGAGIIGGSLADGHYTLTIHGGLVHDGFGQALDGAGTGVAGSDRVDTFFRLFGDADGDGHVDLGDVLHFAGTLGKHAGDPGYLWYFDYDGDGRVDGSDLVQLLRRLGR